jgi:hypothetical protein
MCSAHLKRLKTQVYKKIYILLINYDGRSFYDFALHQSVLSETLSGALMTI